VYLRTYIPENLPPISQSWEHLLNDKGGTPSELDTITDLARRESVVRYGEMELARRKELMDRESKVVDVLHEISY
jgi:hypothetical protein